MLQILSYISKINASKKSMNQLQQELIKSIKFNYEEEKSKINYEEIYINGMLIPKNIEFKDINKTSLNICWIVDEINLINIDKNQIKYKVEMRKKNENAFKEVYQGKETNCLINNLSPKTIYEFRICSFYDDVIGEWTQIQEIETKSIDSLILKESKKDKEFLEEICKWCECKNLELLFRGTKDGMTANDFHNKCDNQGPTVSLIKNDKDHIFGGYASISWTRIEGNKNAPKSFLFTLSNMYNTQPTKFPSQNNGNEVYHEKNYGPIFGQSGNDFYIQSNFTQQNTACSSFPNSFQDVLGRGKAIFTSDENSNNFNIKEIEVFKLIK